eukprot:jgi/Mesen1/2255/ME000153S01478
MGINTQRLVRRESDGLFCSICHDLVDPNGALQAPCDHFWCKDCIVAAITAGQKWCPDDRAQALDIRTLRPLRVQNNVVYRMLLNVNVKCANHEKGCKWQGDLSETGTHEDHCKFGCQRCKKSKSQVAEAQQQLEQMRKKCMESQSQVAGVEQRLKQMQERWEKSSSQVEHGRQLLEQMQEQHKRQSQEAERKSRETSLVMFKLCVCVACIVAYNFMTRSSKK